MRLYPGGEISSNPSCDECRVWADDTLWFIIEVKVNNFGYGCVEIGVQS
jgi:hypothetical protein